MRNRDHNLAVCAAEKDAADLSSWQSDGRLSQLDRPNFFVGPDSDSHA